LNYPLLPGQGAFLEQALRNVSEEAWDTALQLPPYQGPEELRQCGADWLSLPEYPLKSDRVVIATGGHHALMVALMASGMVGQTIATDELTYGGLIAMAKLLDIHLTPCAGDSDGMLPSALQEVRRDATVKGLYLMPTVHNPLGTVMPLRRRAELIAIAREHGLLIFEDDAYGFLEAEAPPNFAHLAPEIAFYIYSLSKPLAPGVRTAFLVLPSEYFVRATEALRLSASGAVPLLGNVTARWLQDGTAALWIATKRREAKRRQGIARGLLAGTNLSGHPTSYHVWLTLPERLPAADLVETLKARGVSIVGASAYSVPPNEAPNAVRLSLGGEMEEERLIRGLSEVAAIVNAL